MSHQSCELRAFRKQEGIWSEVKKDLKNNLNDQAKEIEKKANLVLKDEVRNNLLVDD